MVGGARWERDDQDGANLHVNVGAAARTRADTDEEATSVISTFN